MQSRLESLIEVWINVGIGFSLNFVANYLILPMFGFNVSLSQTFWIGVWFTGVSVIRSYVIRRWAQAHLKQLVATVAAFIKRKLNVQ